MNDFEYNKTKFYIPCARTHFFNSKLKDFIPKITRYCHLRGDLFSPRDNMIDHIWFMMVRNFQEHRRQVTFKLKIKMSDLDM